MEDPTECRAELETAEVERTLQDAARLAMSVMRAREALTRERSESLRTRLAQLERDKEEAEAVAARSAEQVADLDAARASLAKRDRQLASARERAAALEADVDAANERGARLHDRNQELEAEVEAMRATIQALKEESKVSKMVALENERARLAAENARLNGLLLDRAQRKAARAAPSGQEISDARDMRLPLQAQPAAMNGQSGNDQAA